MDIIIADVGATVKKVTLVGKLDIDGAEKIGLPLAAAAGSRANLLIDMAGVVFLSSIGIRHLVLAAKTVARRAGKVVLLDPTPAVSEVLAISGLESLLPIARSEAEAQALLAGGSAG
jgi:anti-anti-sigma factor